MKKTVDGIDGAIDARNVPGLAKGLFDLQARLACICRELGIQSSDEQERFPSSGTGAASVECKSVHGDALSVARNRVGGRDCYLG